MTRRLASVAIVVAAVASSCGQAGEDIVVEPPLFAPGEGPSSVTANTTRLAGGDPLADAVAVTQTVYPATIANENTPGAVVLAPLDDLAMQLTAVQVTHHPINAPVLFATDEGIPDAVRTELRRLVPEGVAQDAGTQIYVVGDLDRAADEAADLGYEIRQFPGADPAEVAADIDAWKSTILGDHEPKVVVGDLDHAELMLPVASFYAHAPVHLVWTREGRIPAATRDALRHRGGDAFLYLVGSPDILDEDLASELRTYGHVQRIDADEAVEMGVRNADFGDISHGEMSWDIAEPGHNYTFVTAPAEDVPPAAVTATVLSHLGKHGPLLVVEPDAVPDDVRRFLEERRPTYVTPNEALHNHGWVIGDDITDDVQAELDALLAVEREPPTTSR